MSVEELRTKAWRIKSEQQEKRIKELEQLCEARLQDIATLKLELKWSSDYHRDSKDSAIKPV